MPEPDHPPPLPDGRLLSEIGHTVPPPGSVAAWWLGQHSFVLKDADGTIVYLDPFLTGMPDRLLPPLLRPEDIHHADVVVGTHDHGDHIDRPAWPALAQASPKAVFVAPAILCGSLADSLGLDPSRLRGMDMGKPVRAGGLTIEAVPAAHERLEAAVDGPGHPCLGVVLRMGGLSIYHAGDTCLYDGIWRLLRGGPRLSCMMLPINGRDAWRYRNDIIGNMTWQEAVDLAGEMDPCLAVPAHWGMFTRNTEDPDKFVEYARVKYPALAVHVPVLGRRFVICDPSAG